MILLKPLLSIWDAVLVQGARHVLTNCLLKLFIITRLVVLDTGSSNLVNTTLGIISKLHSRLLKFLFGVFFLVSVHDFLNIGQAWIVWVSFGVKLDESFLGSWLGTSLWS